MNGISISKVDEVIVADGDIKRAKAVADRFASDCLSYARLNMEKIDDVVGALLISLHA